MNNAIAIIENEPKDFRSVEKIFRDTSKEIWPDHKGFWKNVNPENVEPESEMYEEELILNICNQIEDNIASISAIIMDISLIDEKDDVGIKIIREIRKKKEDIRFSLIPIFCYTRHGDDIDTRMAALRAGATNIFNKEVVDSESSYAKKDIAELKISVDSQMLAYQLVQYSVSSLKKLEDYLNEETRRTEFLVKGVTTLINIDSLNTITEDENAEQMLEHVFGGKEKLTKIKTKMAQLEEKYKQAELLDDISGLLSLIPGLNLFSAFPKVISMVRKNIN